MDPQHLLLAGMSMNSLQHLNMDMYKLLQIGGLFLLYQAVEIVKLHGIPLVKQIIQNRWESKRVAFSKFTDTKSVVSEICFVRNYENASQDFVDSIILHICNLDSMEKLRYESFFMMADGAKFTITDTISGHMQELSFNSVGKLSVIRFTIFSNTLTMSQLKQWTDDVYARYIIKQSNDFGGKQYYIDHISTIETDLVFTKTAFHTSKSLNNLYGEHVAHIRSRVEKFLYNREWYDTNGIPHTLGFLFKGNAGTGKSSIIKAIAKESKRHIFNIRLTDNVSVQAFKRLMFTPNIRIMNANGQIENINVPNDERIYVMEDVDCLTTIVLDRQFAEEQKREKDKELTCEQKKNKKAMDQFVNTENRLNLSVLLNILDGILETPGRLMILTSNYPEKLDKALLRPGRIDCLVEFGNCTTETLYDMCRVYYPTNTFSKEIFEKYAEALSPAVIQELILSNTTFERFYENLPLKLEQVQKQEQDRLASIRVQIDKRAKEDTLEMFKGQFSVI